MQSNPMQRKSRNSFLLGILVMLIIAIIVAGIFYITVVRKEETQEEEEIVAYVYALKQNVNSGQEITADMVKQVEVVLKKVKDEKTMSVQDLIPAKQKNADGALKDISMVTGYKSKINLTEGTILSQSMLYEDETIKNSERLVDFNMLTLPLNVDIGSYVDVRLTLPTGQDLIVLSKKEVKNLYEDTISFYLTEEEILMMNSAIVEAYILPASNIYVTEYVEPGNQSAAKLTYVPTAEVKTLIELDSNITNEARTALQTRFLDSVRTGIDGQIQNVIDRDSNVETGIQEQIEAAKAARKSYLSGLSGQ